MDVSELLQDLFDRVVEHVEAAVGDLDPELLTAAPASGANTIAWQVWHLTRVEDSHVAELLEQDQVWATGGWGARFGLDDDPENTGYGHTPEQVAAVRPDGPDALVDYHAAVSARTRSYLGGLSPVELDRIVDERWDPPVSLGVRLVSIVDDQIQHAGQALYARGLLERGPA
jgi:uncharacterized damage-inducible protein DinB